MKKIVDGIIKAWVILGTMGIVFSAVSWMREGVTSPIGNASYVIPLVFCIFIIASAISANRQKLWGKILFTSLLVLFIFNFIAFLGVMFTGHIETMTGRIMVIATGIFVIFALLTIPSIWIKRQK